jgi:hypothetical protein
MEQPLLISATDFKMLKDAQDTLQFRNTQLNHQIDVNAELSAELEALKVEYSALGRKHAEELSTYRTEMLSPLFFAKMTEACDAALEKYLTSEEFVKQIDSRVEDYLQNADIEVDAHVEKAIEEALEDVRVSFRGR